MARQPGADAAALQRIRGWVTHGVTLDLLTVPEPVDHDNTYSVRVEATTVRTRLAEYEAFQALRQLPADHPCSYGVQPLHVIIKPGRKPRLVVDLSRNLNDHLVYEYFSYTSVGQAVEKATPGCWFSKLDLSNCFLSFPLHPSAWPYFIFRFDGQLYQFTRMPFGLSSAPRICTELLAVPAFAMQQWGVDRSDRYLDDTLLTDSSEEAATRSLLIAQHTLTCFGLVVNPDKTEGPAQQLAFLGIQLNSVARTLSCTPERVQEIVGLLDEAGGGRTLALSRLQTILGKLQFAAIVLPGARPFLQRMTALSNRRLASITTGRTGLDSTAAQRRRHFATAHAIVHVDRIMRDDLAFWRAHLSAWNGRQRWRSAYSEPFSFASDASLHGFGYYIQPVPAAAAAAVRLWPAHLQPGAGFLGVWSPTDARFRSTSSQMIWCEMFAILAILSTYRELIRDSHVLFHMDNEPDVHTLNKQTTRSVQLAGLLREIYTVAVDCNIAIRAIHRPGVDNVLADFLSRTPLRQPAAIVQAWHASEHSASIPLLSVSVVHSQQFGSAQSRPCSALHSAIG